jgi:hypothetical protein
VIAELGSTMPFSRSPGRARAMQLLSLFLFAVLPAITVVTLFATTVADDAVAFDFRVFYAAAESVLDGESPYQALDDPSADVARGYVYPPVTAIATIPFTLLPLEAAGLVAMALLVGVALAIPWVLGVRDWRCFGMLLLWPPVLSAIQTGSVTLLLALGAALAWRYRNRPFATGLAAGATLSMKLILWPLLVWLAATRRLLAAAATVVVGAALVLASWAVIGFAGFGDYPDVLRRLQDVVEVDAYTLYVVARDAGASSELARGVWLGAGLLVLGGVVFLARRGDERTAFMLAIAASLALSPIVWMHYFALLLVVVALAQPRLGVAWIAPLAFVITPGSGHPSAFDTAWALGVAVVVVALAVRSSTGAPRPAVVGVADPRPA